jgi:flavin reductase (DIM6/NTAB) family NADH-FMN oxidoreductase RutF
MTFDTRAFRNALGCFPTGVAVVTAESPGPHPKGITVNSFTSASLDPPLVLWCVDRGSERCETFMTARGFTISVLDAAHRTLSARLARRGEHSLDGIALLPTKLGAPALAEALAVFECEREAIHPAGDHVILLGRVMRFSFRKSGSPLVFYRGRYVRLHEAE